MPKIIYYVAASLDGYVATPGGGVDWLADFESAGEDYGYAVFYASIDAVLLGRRTFEQIQGFGAGPKENLHLVIVRSYQNGVVQLHFARAKIR